MVTENQLLPYFGKMRLDKITAEVIEKWFDFMVKKGYKNTYTNGAFAILRVMLTWAFKKKLISSNPSMEVTMLVNNKRHLVIITQEEFKALFVKDWKRVWNNDRLACIASKLAALTGIRSSEVRGLRGEYVFDGYIHVCTQYDRYGYRPTKTKDQRNIPLVPQMIAELRELMAVNGNGYLFSHDGGATPVQSKYFYKWYKTALVNIGIDEKAIKERGLCFHSLRHFCNTEMQKGGLSVQKVQAVTGHKSSRMTELYSHFNPMELAEVPVIQEGLLQEKQNSPEKEPDGKQPVILRIVKPEAEAEKMMA